MISGTPTTNGTFNFTVKATDANASFITKPLTIAVYSPLVVSTSSLPAGTVGTAYSQTLAATGGLAPYTWAITVGALPTGLSLNSATGVISGTPTTVGTVNFTIQATDTNTTSASKSLSIYTNSATSSTIKSGSSQVSYNSLSEAYSASLSGDNLQIKAVTLNENIDFNRDVLINLRGGFNPDFTAQEGHTVINGSITVSSGSIVIENISVK